MVFWAKWDPIWAQWDSSGQFVRKVGKWVFRHLGPWPPYTGPSRLQPCASIEIIQIQMLSFGLGCNIMLSMIRLLLGANSLWGALCILSFTKHKSLWCSSKFSHCLLMITRNQIRKNSIIMILSTENTRASIDPFLIKQGRTPPISIFQSSCQRLRPGLGSWDRQIPRSWLPAGCTSILAGFNCSTDKEAMAMQRIWQHLQGVALCSTSPDYCHSDSVNLAALSASLGDVSQLSSWLVMICQQGTTNCKATKIGSLCLFWWPS